VILGAIAALALVAVPSATQRWRVEIAGEPVGFTALDVACGPEGCTMQWESALRAPEPSEGLVLRRMIEARTRPDGRARWVRAAVGSESAALGQREAEDGEGPVPASLAELVLSSTREGERRCLTVREEATGEQGQACATRRGDWLEGEVLGVGLRFRAKPGEPPEEVEVPAQRARFVADPQAGVPARAPRLLETEVPLAPGAARADGTPAGPLRFCGLAPEPPFTVSGVDAEVPRGWPDGASCREKTARYVARAAAAGLPARHVVGVAWDGDGFAWHEWAEVFSVGAWLPVDPSFRQLPAAGPRFAVARFPDGDPRARQAAGRAILACWGRARVERSR
jgi:hypothetical protein